MQNKNSKTIYKKKVKLPESGIIKLNCLMNSTRVDITDEKGNVLMWKTASGVGFKNCKKGTPLAAASVVEHIIKDIVEGGLKKADLEVKGIGSGRNVAIKKFLESPVEINTLKYMIKFAHNGCRPKKARRT